MPLDIKGLIATGMAIAQDLGADATVSATITQAIRPVSYNALTGAVTPNNQTATVKCLLSVLTAERAAAMQMQVGDERGVIYTKDLQDSGGFTKIEQDAQISIGGNARTILKLVLDPTGLVYQVFMRKTV